MKNLILPAFLLAFPGLALAQSNINDNLNYVRGCPVGRDSYWGGMMGGFGNMMGWGGMPFLGPFGGIIMIVFWILLIIAIVYLVRNLVGGSEHRRKRWMEEKMRMMKTRKEDSAITILKERYAKGEIDKKEFEEKTKELKDL